LQGLFGRNIPAQDATPLVPLGGDDIAVLIESGTVWRGRDSFTPVFGGDFIGVELLGVVVCTEAFDDFSFFVENGDAAG